MNHNEREILDQLRHQFMIRKTIKHREFDQCLRTLIAGENPFKVHSEFWDEARKDPNFNLGGIDNLEINQVPEKETIYVTLFRKNMDCNTNPMVKAFDNPEAAKQYTRKREISKKSGQFYTQFVELERQL